ncbi:HER064Wp [Eremothecium sinecaudum]|uniref:HER064Wp n=1 Tax=Eremothecium sinecaudum TaxID=45286 RepID=A0A109UZN6_9SACH|nr:HER064Wp [Eremothecium sinecaudum]AMD21343.1 HER064Wp [Eremothecium sinecaudum]
MQLKAATRNNITNRLFMTTILVAFSSVALGSILPCPAHTLESDTSLDDDSLMEHRKQRQHSRGNP